MKIDLLKTYDDMIKNDKTSQSQIDNSYNAIYMDYFVRPDLRVNQRAGHKSNGEFIEGRHIYPDKECICEMLKKIQDYLNNNITILQDFKSNKLGMFLFISEIVNACINTYFGTTEKINETDEVFHVGNNSSEVMDNLSDFKNTNSAVCIERALATHILLSVISNNEVLKDLYPYRSFMSVIELCLNVEKSARYDGAHALCGIVSRENEKEMYLLDSINYGLVEDKNGNKQYVYGLYELSKDEIELMFNHGAIEPTLFRCKHLDGLTQLSHRAITSDPRLFLELHSKYGTGQSK